MSQEYSLEVNILDELELLRDFINDKKYWCTFNYNYVYKKVAQIQEMINNYYSRHAYQKLQDSSRQIFENTFAGDVKLFIEYYNAFLYTIKLRQKVEYHQYNGEFFVG